MTISVCVGSSCHLLGSYDVINALQKEITDRSLDDKITLKAAFCLNNCGKGVNIDVDGKRLTGYNAENASERFVSEILPLLG